MPTTCTQPNHVIGSLLYLQPLHITLTQRASRAFVGMQIQAELLVGDTLISAACVAYYGAFTGPFRATLVAAWIARCQSLGIPTSPSCMLRASLAPQAQVLHDLTPAARTK